MGHVPKMIPSESVEHVRIVSFFGLFWREMGSFEYYFVTTGKNYRV